MRWALQILAVCFVLAAGMGQAQAPGKRVALVIANANYAGYRQLPNAGVDAGLVSTALRAAGFEVEQQSDLGIAQFRTALGRFQARAAGAEVALVYFAGHGMEAGGKNWLIPADARLATDAELDFQAIEANLVIRAAAGALARIVVLDACRDNPFAGRMRSTGVYRITRAGGGGLSALDVQSARGTLLMYSAASGEVANDGAPGQGSPFARAFARHLPEPGVELRVAAGKIADAVFAETGQTQLPFTTTSLSGSEIYLVPRAPGRESDVERQLREARERIASLERERSSPVPPASAGIASPTSTPGASRPMPAEAGGTGARAPGSVFRDCPDCPEMVVIPAGSFTMGSPADEAGREADEGPQRTVNIRSFAAGRYEVTLGEWKAFVAASGRANSRSDCFASSAKNGSWRDPGFAQDDRHPVACVSWRDAQAYALWLSQKTGQTYRLLTEAEWEYAARAGTTGTNWFSGPVSPDKANYSENGNRGTVRVGTYGANPFGLHDTAGNLWEWTEDCYSNSHTGAFNDGSAVVVNSCGDRVIRGGSFLVGPTGLRSAVRSGGALTGRFNVIGFRLAKSL